MSSSQLPDPTRASPLSIGDVVSDRYRIDGLLGEGGMGVVYRVEHLHLRKPYALKVLLPEWSQVPEIVARFEREAVTAANIHSPHVAAATDFGRLPDGAFFLVMEYVGGRTLRAALAAGPLSTARARHVFRGMVGALHAAHSLGIVHRDMKPENVMLIERDGDPDFVKVLDFGIAKADGLARADGSQPLTRAGSIMGTPTYMSPEQALGQPVDARSDLYALGVIFFEMLTGRPPFDGGELTLLRQHIVGEVPELPDVVAAGIHPAYVALLRRLLAKAPENRFASAAELLAVLDQAGEEGSPALPSVVVVPAPLRPSLANTPASAGLTDLGRRLPSLLRGVTRRQWRTAGLVATALGLLLVAEALGGTSKAPAIAALVAGSSAPTVSPASTQTAPVVATRPEPSDAPSLPPPPAPSSGGSGSPARSDHGRPAASASAGHRTGPGGIYIPPPSQWFR